MHRDVAVTFDEQIEELDREITIRRRFYPKSVTEGKMNADVAGKQLARIIAVKNTLLSLKQYRNSVPQPFFSLRIEHVDV